MAVCSFGNGAIPLRKVQKILKANGYSYVRNNGDHMVYKHESGDTISIAPKCATPQIKRIFKEHNIDKDLINKKNKKKNNETKKMVMNR